MKKVPSSTTALSPDILGGIALLLASIAALAVVNLGGGAWYHTLLETHLQLGIAPLALDKSLHHWINDGLMSLFFLLVGIEIHHELRHGSLKNPRAALVPIIAAIGGAVTPAVFYLFFTHHNPQFHSGWSIPTATDIAFAIAVVTVLKDYVPTSLRVFLLALAVADDLLAIIVIAIFYTAEVVWLNLFLAAMALGFLIAKNLLGLRALWIYLAMGFLMWLAVLQSGVHATVAGVLLGVLLPTTNKSNHTAPAALVEHALKPWVRWLVLPLFAFANVGIDLTALSLATTFTPVTLGIAKGLFFGKQLGVLGTVWLLEKMGLPRPHGSTWLQVYGIACLCGIGFTMSLFIAALALPPELQPQARLGILLGSTASALLGAFVLTRTSK
ncbi:MAG: Na+/H+ antiporter NhaA [Alphaproteobacteria bacterium]